MVNAKDEGAAGPATPINDPTPPLADAPVVILEDDLGQLWADYNPGVVAVHFGRFYKQILALVGADPWDFYTPMVSIQFVSFTVICFGWSAFADIGLPPTSTADLLQQNTVPLKLLMFMIAQFVVIVVDRVLYTWRLLKWKFALHVFLVALIHIMVFFVVPVTTHRPFVQNPILIIFYLLQVSFSPLIFHLAIHFDCSFLFQCF